MTMTFARLYTTKRLQYSSFLGSILQSLSQNSVITKKNYIGASGYSSQNQPDGPWFHVLLSDSQITLTPSLFSGASQRDELGCLGICFLWRLGIPRGSSDSASMEVPATIPEVVFEPGFHNGSIYRGPSRIRQSLLVGTCSKCSASSMTQPRWPQSIFTVDDRYPA